MENQFYQYHLLKVKLFTFVRFGCYPLLADRRHRKASNFSSKHLYRLKNAHKYLLIVSFIFEAKGTLEYSKHRIIRHDTTWHASVGDFRVSYRLVSESRGPHSNFEDVIALKSETTKHCAVSELEWSPVQHSIRVSVQKVVFQKIGQQKVRFDVERAL